MGDWGPIGWSNPISVMVTPFAECRIHPAGSADSRNDLISAGNDAVIRFYPPPPSWGTRFIFDCTANGNTSETTTFTVDLNDSSTFFREPELLKGPQVVGELPALSGDPSTISKEELMRGGYPPRPDAAKQPDAYARWLQQVTNPTEVLGAKPIGIVGRGHANAAFQGRATSLYTVTSYNWAGMALDPAGFNSTSHQPNSGGPALVSYEADITIPTAGTCPANQYCQASIWGGIGGLGEPSDDGLVQSGYVVNQGPGEQSVLFFEYFPDTGMSYAASQLPSGALTPGQIFITGGCISDANGAFDPTGQYAAFSSYGTTPSNTFWHVSWVAPIPSGRHFYGLASEAIVELPASSPQQPIYLAQLVPGTNRLLTLSAADANSNNYSNNDDNFTPWIFINLIDSANNIMAYPYYTGDPNLPPRYPFTSDSYDSTTYYESFYVGVYNQQ
jgi:hypothetical protein